MSDEGFEGFISRWSRRKILAKRAERQTPVAQEPANTPPATQAAAAPDEPASLPPVESLTPESDFSPFMRPGVDAGTRRLAVKKLFEDPRYNVMDGLDVYIDDYSKPDPLPEGWLEKMNQVARLGAFQPAAVEDEKTAEIATALPEPQPIAHVQGEAQTAAPAVTSDDPIDASQVEESRPRNV